MNLEEITILCEMLAMSSEISGTRELAALVVALCREVRDLQMELSVKLDDPEYVTAPSSPNV